MTNSPSSPRKDAGRSHPSPSDWEAFTHHLACRRERPPLTELLDRPSSPPVLWCRPDAAAGADAVCSRIHDVLRARKKRRDGGPLLDALESWLAGPAEDALEGPTALSVAYQCLAWAEALPALAAWLPAAPWSELLNTLCEIAEQARATGSQALLVGQLFAGELPYRLAYAFPEIDRCRDLATLACDTMSETLLEMMDGEGLPSAEALSELRPWLASLTRCQLMAAQGPAALNTKAVAQMQWAVTQCLRLTRSDGRQPLTPGGSGDWDADCMRALLQIAADDEDLAAARLAAPQGKQLTKSVSQNESNKIKTSRDNGKSLARPTREPAVNSEWAELAVLRGAWKKTTPHWTIAYSDGRMRSELSTRKNVVWSGDWTASLTINGESMSPSTEWSENCWHDDQDVCYLELERKLANDWILQRQMLLAKDDGFAYFADAILGRERATIGYESILPVPESIAWRTDEQTRDGSLCDASGKPLARVLPLGFPEWRNEKAMGEARNTLDGFRLRVETEGQALYAPLFLGLKKSHLHKELTWRRLTVAEDLTIAGSDEAVAYRVQIGDKQWVLYRSLTPPANRTFLGQNRTSDFYCGRFLRSGATETLLELT